MHCSYHPDYFLPLPPGHPFPMAKYPLLRARLLRDAVIAPGDLAEPAEASLEDLGRVHTGEYLARLAAGTLGAADVRRLGVPWSTALWRRARLAAQGTLDAAHAALSHGLAANLAGGTHHAFAGHGEGYCVLNDVAVAIRALQHAGRLGRALVIDLDVHQGNGTAAIFAGAADVYTFSMHGERNYPSRKMRSTRDVGLADGLGDAPYLALLAEHLQAVLAEFEPALVFYVAGVDPAQGDRYGRLALTDAGIRRRDRCVLEACVARGLPVAITLGGGYAPTAERTAALHAIVFEEAVALERRAGRADAAYFTNGLERRSAPKVDIGP
jgi:acetoin utilization deacetylase AcuC-like enzyme